MTRRIVRWGAPAIALVALIAFLVVLSRPSGAQRRIEEDEPGWDCRTMGNRICGPMPTFVLHDHPGMACWLEPNDQQPLKVEEICRPATTTEGH